MNCDYCVGILCGLPENFGAHCICDTSEMSYVYLRTFLQIRACISTELVFKHCWHQLFALNLFPLLVMCQKFCCLLPVSIGTLIYSVALHKWRYGKDEIGYLCI